MNPVRLPAAPCRAAPFRAARRALYALLLCPAMLAAQPGPPTWTGAGTSRAAVRATLGRLQRGVRAGDRAAVSALFGVPAQVWMGDCYTLVLDRAQVRRRYDAIFTPELRRAVASWSMDDVYLADEGVGIAEGRLWLAAVGPANALRILYLNPGGSVGEGGEELHDCPRTPRPVRGSVAGEYRLVTGYTAGCSLSIRQPSRTLLRLALECDRGAPTHHQGFARGTMTLHDGSATWSAHYGGRCAIRFDFEAGGVNVHQAEERAGCGFGAGVSADGYYRRVGRRAVGGG